MDNIPDAGGISPAHFPGGVVDPFHQGAAVNPLLAGMPALHRGGVEQILAHIADLQGRIVDARLGGVEIADQAQGAADHFAGIFDLGEAGVLEAVGIEQHPQHGADFVAGAEVFRLQLLNQFRIPRRRVLPSRHLRLVGHKEVVEVAGDEAGGGRLLADDADHILAVPVAGFAQEGLVLLDMVEAVVEEAVGIAAIGIAGDGVGDGPAGKSLGAGFHIVLAIVGLAVHADAHREQLQQFPAPVLVDRLFVAELVVQVVEHGRVGGQVHEEVVELAEAVGPEVVQLQQDLAGAHTLGVADAENAVPEQADFLLQLAGGVDHAVGPVALVRHQALEVAPTVHIAVHHVHLQVRLGLRVEQLLHGGFVADGGAAFRFLVGSAEAGPAHQVRHQHNVLVVCHTLSPSLQNVPVRPNPAAKGGRSR